MLSVCRTSVTITRSVICTIHTTLGICAGFRVRGMGGHLLVLKLTCNPNNLLIRLTHAGPKSSDVLHYTVAFSQAFTTVLAAPFAMPNPPDLGSRIAAAG